MSNPNVNTDQGYELSWDSEISRDSEFTTLPEGDYDFEVIRYERGRYTPGKDARLPPCNMVTLDIDVGGDIAKARVKHRLFLHSRCEGMLCAFFTAIGHRKHGETMRMNFDGAVGCTGRCKVTVREYTSDRGDKRTVNQIERFYEPDKAAQDSEPSWK